MRRLNAFAAAVAAAAALAACTEVPQEAGKSYAGKEDAKPYAGDMFKGDKAKWETALSMRNEGQNDYSPQPSSNK